jgi:hypothetical protein
VNAGARNLRPIEAICRRSLIYRTELSKADALLSGNSEGFNLDQTAAPSLRRRG